ncbi:TetR/AcrR family transcriptional regulator [Paenibacillus macerans]|uniref:TetR/AcrR family transcriptional regulator n=1 Tax=Paenibacillus macerans TaxID=44252 RepID=UPI0018C302BB|nr:TetR/AcrR family transcriptional regulator [Paenibacillus macerans]UMV49292.1 TetR/AcrR family transcriptional regulator [Paenibacillus macerans]
MSKKTAIIDAAFQLFQEKGFVLTTIDEIAKASGMTKPSFYKYFPSKEDLLLEVLEIFTEELEEQVQRLYRKVDLSKSDRIIELCLIYLEDIFKYHTYLDFFLDPSQHFFENEHIQNAVMTVERKVFTWLQDSIVDLYGEQMDGFAVDVSFIAVSIMFVYTRVCGPNLSHDQNRKLAVYIEYLVGVVVEGLKFKKPDMPLLFETPSWIMNCWPEDVTPVMRSRQLQQVYRRMESIIQDHASLSDSEKQDYLQAIAQIKTDSKDSLNQNIVIKALLYYLEQLDELRDECGQLRRIFEPETSPPQN